VGKLPSQSSSSIRTGLLAPLGSLARARFRACGKKVHEWKENKRPQGSIVERERERECVCVCERERKQYLRLLRREKENQKTPSLVNRERTRGDHNSSHGLDRAGFELSSYWARIFILGVCFYSFRAIVELFRFPLTYGPMRVTLCLSVTVRCIRGLGWAGVH